jgi:hypothetical protein
MQICFADPISPNTIRVLFFEKIAQSSRCQRHQDHIIDMRLFSFDRPFDCDEDADDDNCSDK